MGRIRFGLVHDFLGYIVSSFVWEGGRLSSFCFKFCVASAHQSSYLLVGTSLKRKFVRADEHKKLQKCRTLENLMQFEYSLICAYSGDVQSMLNTVNSTTSILCLGSRKWNGQKLP